MLDFKGKFLAVLSVLCLGYMIYKALFNYVPTKPKINDLDNKIKEIRMQSTKNKNEEVEINNETVILLKNIFKNWM